MSLDPYKILGVEKSADAAAIKTAYRKLARKYHPDVNPGDKQAEDKFKEISEAYDILSDPAKKAEYDNLGREAFYEKGFGGTGYQRPDFSQGFSFADIFGDLFGAGSPRGASSSSRGGFSFETGFNPRASVPRRGEDVNLKITIPFREAALGTERTLELGIPELCQKCQGQGIVSSGGGVRNCPVCGGSGQVSHTQSLKAKIPAGIDSGQKLRLRGKGSQGENGGAPGDLLLEISILPDPVFTRQGRDLSAVVDVSLYDALLGGSIEVPTLSGRASIKIPSGSQNGRKLRLKGQGIPASKKQEAGNLYVTLKVVLPTKLNDKAKELVAELAAIAPIGSGK